MQQRINRTNTRRAYLRGTHSRRFPMRSLRTLEARVLGYTIERVEERDHLGTVSAQWYEVMCPESNAVLASAGTRGDVEKAVIRRELDSARRALPLNSSQYAA